MKEILYSPWRIKYILDDQPDGCIFCLKPKADNDREHLILQRGKHCFVIMNLYPYNNGHLMVVPYRHVSTLQELKSAELSELMDLAKLCENVMQKVYQPHGFNLGMNIGKAGGAGIESHLHLHIVPRWNGDSNFMTVTGNTRVVPESFQRAYSNLKEQFDNASQKK
jgi:ATP adenylyltransferase